MTEGYTVVHKSRMMDGWMDRQTDRCTHDDNTPWLRGQNDVQLGLQDKNRPLIMHIKGQPWGGKIFTYFKNKIYNPVSEKNISSIPFKNVYHKHFKNNLIHIFIKIKKD